MTEDQVVRLVGWLSLIFVQHRHRRLHPGGGVEDEPGPQHSHPRRPGGGARRLPGLVERHRDAPAADAPDSPRGKVFDKLDAARIEEIQIAAGSGEAIILRKVDNAWRLTAPVAVPATTRPRPAAPPRNLATAGVRRRRRAAQGPRRVRPAKPRVTITFRVAGDKLPRTLLLGDKNPTGSDLYAKLP